MSNIVDLLPLKDHSITIITIVLVTIASLLYQLSKNLYLSYNYHGNNNHNKVAIVMSYITIAMILIIQLRLRELLS